MIPALGGRIQFTTNRAPWERLFWRHQQIREGHMSKDRTKARTKKSYVKPEAKKHKAAAIVSGSSDSCSLYRSSSDGLVYYH